MNTPDWIQTISVKDVDVAFFVEKTITDELFRDELIEQMVANPAIMVYYHCYYVASQASHDRPELFYRYWPEMVSLLHHKNSYHRDIGLTILANLTRVDHEGRFLSLFEDYFAHIDDVKFMTGQCCVRNSLKILKNLPELQSRILSLLLDVGRRCSYSDKQKALLHCDVLDIFDEMYSQIGDKKGADAFIESCAGSISPKTRRKAKELERKYGAYSNRL